MRISIPLREDWLFHRGDIRVEKPKEKGPAYSQSKTERKLLGPAAYRYPDTPNYYQATGVSDSACWEKVEIPHDYVVGQDLQKEENGAFGYLHYDNAWYRRHFRLPEGSLGKRVTLRFDGIAGTSVIYVNGCEMAHNYSAYNTFETDITDIARYDEDNVLAVYVNTEGFEGWWYQGGGIYRDVILTVTDPVCIDLWGVYCMPEKTGDTDWEVPLETTVLNTGYTQASVTVRSEILTPDGALAGSASVSAVIPSREQAVLRGRAAVCSPQLWDCACPNLYTVRTVLERDGEEIDAVTVRTGFRTAEFSAEKGFLLNGKPLFINGVCAHQDFGLTGLAVPANIARHKMKMIREMGANGYRTSHYQQTEAYLDACDELGILVMDEARWFESTPEALSQLDSLVKRDRNRPSVILWSTGNEEPTHWTDTGRRLHRAIADHIRKLDPGRQITAAQSHSPEKSLIYDLCDVIGINYNLDAYDTVHAQYPDKPVFASECCATGTTRDWNFDTDTNGRIRDRDTDTTTSFLSREKTYRFLRERPYVFGCFQWDAVEHRGEATWPRMCSVSGAMDIFLRKKGAFYQNLSHWSEEPMVHIVPHWNFRGMEGEVIPVTVYTNCEEAELFLNGESLGRKRIPKYGRGDWEVPYAGGTLKGLGYRGGEALAEDVRQTTGTPVSLRLTQDNAWEANGQDIALFVCECLDAEGRPVPDASEYVRFSAAAPARIIGTGSDNCDHHSVTDAARRMYMGKITVAVKPAAGQTEIRITAAGEHCGVLTKVFLPNSQEE